MAKQMRYPPMSDKRPLVRFSPHIPKSEKESLFKKFASNLATLRNVYNHYICNVNFNPELDLRSVGSALSYTPTADYFDKFVTIASRSVGVDLKPLITSNLPTKEVVDREDDKQIATYLKQSFSIPSGINIDYLLEAFIYSATSMGFTLLPDGSFHSRKTIYEAYSGYDSNTSSAYPTMRKKSNSNSIDLAVSFVTNYLLKPELSKLLSMPCILFHRLTFNFTPGFKSLEYKVRQVWAVPFAVLTLQNQQYGSVVDYVTEYQSRSTFPPTTMGRDLKSISTLLKILTRDAQFASSIDVSKMDSNVPCWFICLFHTMLQSLTDNATYKDVLVKRHLMVFDALTPFLHRDKTLKFMLQGNVSGGKFTSVLNSMLSLTIANYACLVRTKGRRLMINQLLVLGDDNFTKLNYISISDLLTSYKLFGLTVKEDTAELIDDFTNFEFLGYIWNNYNPTHSIEWFAARFCITTRYWSDYSTADVPTYYLYRAIAISSLCYNGLYNFEKLIGHSYKPWKNLVNQYLLGRDPTILWLTDDPTYSYKEVVPFKSILSNWDNALLPPSLYERVDYSGRQIFE